MTAATSMAPRDADESRREEALDGERYITAVSNAFPLPGVMDFLGAHVGGELAEERWR